MMTQGTGNNVNDSLRSLSGDQRALPSNEKDKHSLYSSIMNTMWKGAQHTAKRATTVTIMTTARCFFLDSQGRVVSVQFSSANVTNREQSYSTKLEPGPRDRASSNIKEVHG